MFGLVLPHIYSPVKQQVMFGQYTVPHNPGVLKYKTSNRMHLIKLWCVCNCLFSTRAIYILVNNLSKRSNDLTTKFFFHSLQFIASSISIIFTKGVNT